MKNKDKPFFTSQCGLAGVCSGTRIRPRVIQLDPNRQLQSDPQVLRSSISNLRQNLSCSHTFRRQNTRLHFSDRSNSNEIPVVLSIFIMPSSVDRTGSTRVYERISEQKNTRQCLGVIAESSSADCIGGLRRSPTRYNLSPQQTPLELLSPESQLRRNETE